VKSRVTAMRGDLQQAITYCLEASQHTSEGNLALELDTRITLGYEYFLSGDYANASQVLEAMIETGISSGAVLNTVAASCLLARLYANQGLLNRSYDTYQRAAQSIPGASDQHLGARSLVEVGLAELLYERDDLDSARQQLEAGLENLPLWDKADDMALAYTTLARINLAGGKLRETQDALAQAERFIHTRGVFAEARAAVEAARVKLWLAGGDLRAARRWAEAQEARFDADGGYTYHREPVLMALARVWLADQEPQKALHMLSRLAEEAASGGRTGRLLEISILRVRALQEKGETGPALQTLGKCLAWAEPEGYRQVFLGEGRSMQRLLDAWLAQADPGPLRDYAARLRSHFERPTQVGETAGDHVSKGNDVPPGKKAPSGCPPPGMDQVLMEPLSRRELEVLQLIAEGNPNREIAHRLIISPGTVKAHTSNIYRKLDVANRTEAVARARQLGILP
jgi:LuxR family maltose regulon positive regulatory protein